MCSLPINAGFLLKRLIKLQHLDPGNNEKPQFGQQLAHQPEGVVDLAPSVPPHAAAWPPEDQDLAPIQQLLPALQHPLQAGVGHNPHVCALPDILLEPFGGSVVHPDDAVRLIDFSPPSVSG